MRFLVLIAVVALLFLAAWFWLKAEYYPSQAVGVAQEFLKRINNQEVVQAFDLTLQNNVYVGRSLAEFKPIARANCAEARFNGLHPFQSNGNRLRRWFAGFDPEIPEIVVEFLCPYPFGVRLRRDGKRNWKVFYFAAHAG